MFVLKKMSDYENVVWCSRSKLAQKMVDFVAESNFIFSNNLKEF